jgi:hypothetical protein
MTPINFQGANVLFQKPTNWDDSQDGKCGDLPVMRTEDGRCVSCWQPTKAELFKLMMGKPVFLHIVMNGIQHPVMLTVD